MVFHCQLAKERGAFDFEKVCRQVDQAQAALIKDLKLGGSSQVLKQGTKAKNIRLVDGDHEIDLIVEGDDRRVVAIETKLSTTKPRTA